MGKRQRRRLRAGEPQDPQGGTGTPAVTVTAGLAAATAAVSPAGEPEDKDEYA